MIVFLSDELFLRSENTLGFGIFLFISATPRRPSKATSAEMPKTPPESRVYIIVKCVTHCCAVLTQVSHTISQVHAPRREAKQ